MGGEREVSVNNKRERERERWAEKVREEGGGIRRGKREVRIKEKGREKQLSRESASREEKEWTRQSEIWNTRKVNYTREKQMEKVNNLDFNRSWGQIMVSRQDLGFGLKPEDDPDILILAYKSSTDLSLSNYSPRYLTLSPLTLVFPNTSLFFLLSLSLNIFLTASQLLSTLILCLQACSLS